MNIYSLPDDIFDYIGKSLLDSIQSKKNLKLCSKHNNSLINISCNFTNKFISWCENIKFDYQYVNMGYLKLCDKMICKNNDSIELWYSYIPECKHSLIVSPKKIKFDLIGCYHPNTFKMYMEGDSKKWLWYHSIVKLRSKNSIEWKEL